MEFKHVIDQYPTVNQPLSAKYVKSFAHLTFKKRIPSIIQNFIDDLENTEQMRKDVSEEALLQVENLVAKFQELRSSIVSDKPMEMIYVGSDLLEHQDWYHEELQIRQAENDGNPPSWFQTDWLFAECFFYFTVIAIFRQSEPFGKFDPTQKSKIEAFVCSKNEISFLTEFWYEIKQKGSLSETEKKDYFVFFLKCALWGNQADLSLSQGKVIAMKDNMLREIGSMDQQILSNDIEKCYDLLCRDSDGYSTVDIVLDNSGFELFNDLVFADFLVTFGLADRIRFHCKMIPWFISDVTVADFEMLLHLLESRIKTEHADTIKHSWVDYIRIDTWGVEVEAFWTLPFDYSKMQQVDPKLYAELSSSKLVIFKGDLNYRKLVGDIYWEPTTSFQSALRGFEPTNVLALRTIKADTVSGLAEGVFEKLNQTEPNWMQTGKYALVQISQIS